MCKQTCSLIATLATAIQLCSTVPIPPLLLVSYTFLMPAATQAVTPATAARQPPSPLRHCRIPAPRLPSMSGEFNFAQIPPLPSFCAAPVITREHRRHRCRFHVYGAQLPSLVTHPQVMISRSISSAALAIAHRQVFPRRRSPCTGDISTRSRFADTKGARSTTPRRESVAVVPLLRPSRSSSPCGPHPTIAHPPCAA